MEAVSAFDRMTSGLLHVGPLCSEAIASPLSFGGPEPETLTLPLPQKTIETLNRKP